MNTLWSSPSVGFSTKGFLICMQDEVDEGLQIKAYSDVQKAPKLAAYTMILLLAKQVWRN